MKITFLKNKSKKLSYFKKREWELIHPKHYGEKLDWNYWDNKKIRIKAEEKGIIVGGLKGSYMAGVLHVEELIVDHSKRGLGIGKSLLKEAEKYAIQNKAHLIYLETGENWKAVLFYQKLGYKKEFLFKKMYSKKNFWVLTKYL